MFTLSIIAVLFLTSVLASDLDKAIMLAYYSFWAAGFGFALAGLVYGFAILLFSVVLSFSLLFTLFFAASLLWACNEADKWEF